MKYLFLTKEALAGPDAWRNVMSLPLPKNADWELVSQARKTVLDYLEFVSNDYFILPDAVEEGVEELQHVLKKLIEICLARVAARERGQTEIPEN